MNIDKGNYNHTIESEIETDNSFHMAAHDTHLIWHKLSKPYRIPEEKWMLDNAILDCKNHLVPWVTTGPKSMVTLWQQKRLKKID